MSKSITVSDGLYSRLEQQASQHGQTIETYLEELTIAPDSDQETALLDRLRAKGLLVTWPHPHATISEHPPVRIKGEPLSHTIIEDRR